MKVDHSPGFKVQILAVPRQTSVTEFRSAFDLSVDPNVEGIATYKSA